MPALHTDLQRFAARLANNGKGRPSQVDLRRAVSSSYYAVFHALTSEFCTLFPGGATPITCRVMDHGHAKKVANEIKKNRVILGVPVEADAKQFCEDFIRLQEARHDADYALAHHLTRKDAVEHVERSDRCLTFLGGLKRSDPALLRALVLSFTFTISENRNARP